MMNHHLKFIFIIYQYTIINYIMIYTVSSLLNVVYFYCHLNYYYMTLLDYVSL